jgi:hypothetical protein
MYLGIGSIFAQEKLTDQDCERMVKERDKAAIQQLIKNPKSYVNYNLSPPILVLAIKAKDYELIQFIFDQGMSRQYNWHIYASTTYLQDPIRQDDYAMVEYLLNFCEITPEDAGLAVLEGRREIVELFLEKGFDFRKAYWIGGFPGYSSNSTPMFVLAIDYEKYDIAKRLLPLTGDVNANTIYRGGEKEWGRIGKETALELVQKNADKSIVPWLLSNGALSYEEKVASLSYQELLASKEFEYEALSAVDSLCIRSQPNLQGQVLGTLARNERVGVLRTSEKPVELDGKTDYWYHIVTQAGLKGWVFGGYLERIK